MAAAARIWTTRTPARPDRMAGRCAGEAGGLASFPAYTSRWPGQLHGATCAADPDAALMAGSWAPLNSASGLTLRERRPAAARVRIPAQASWQPGYLAAAAGQDEYPVRAVAAPLVDACLLAGYRTCRTGRVRSVLLAGRAISGTA